jgi:Cdc6-like AAA superfamily ATPase
MDTLDLNNILDRTENINKLKNALNNFNEKKDVLSTIRGMYVYGDPGTGKTHFVKKILNEMNYDVIVYNAGDIRNKNVFDLIADSNMGDKNIMSMFQKHPKRIAIIMDEIDGMNNGDKGGISSLIKLVRPKKTKRQKQESITKNPIICIGNYHIDKKIKELMKVCINIELNTPNHDQMKNILTKVMPTLIDNIHDNIITYLKGDLRKLKTLCEIYDKQKNILDNNIITNIFTSTNYCDDVKVITKKLINNKYELNDVNIILNETDKTSIALLFHENIVDVISKLPKNKSLVLYQQILDNICYGDYMDRITFQKQIWLLTEITFLLKTMKNNLILHDNINNINYDPVEVRFTKVLTKYSSEYNNDTFIQKLCEELNLDRKDLYLFFIKLKEKLGEGSIEGIFDTIDKLEISRVYKFLDYIYTFDE